MKLETIQELMKSIENVKELAHGELYNEKTGRCCALGCLGIRDDLFGDHDSKIMNKLRELGFVYYDGIYRRWEYEDIAVEVIESNDENPRESAKRRRQRMISWLIKKEQELIKAKKSGAK